MLCHKILNMVLDNVFLWNSAQVFQYKTMILAIFPMQTYTQQIHIKFIVNHLKI